MSSQSSSENATIGDEDGISKTIGELFKKLFRKEILNRPPNFNKTEDIETHLKNIENYCKMAMIINNEEKFLILLDSLESDIKAEIMMAYGFKEFEGNYEWLQEKLQNTYSIKQSQTSPLLKLLKINQRNGESISEFLTSIRVNAYKFISHLNTEEREKLMLKSFYNGLANKNLAEAIKTFKPKTLDEAYSLAKEECRREKRNEVENIDFVQNKDDSKNELIALMLKKIQMLENRISKLENSGYQDKHKRFNQNKGKAYQSQKLCNKCNKPGHYSSECKLQRRCFRCGKTGHISKYCYLNKNNINAIGLQEEYNNSDCQSLENENYSEIDVSFNDEKDRTETCYTIVQEQLENEKNRIFETTPRKPKRVERNIDIVDKHVNFINGHGKKPKKAILKNECINKPLVLGRVHQVRSNILLDTGATCNLIEKKWIDKLEAEKKVKCYITPTNSYIQCANQSNMACVGEVILPFSIGGSQCDEKFLIVNKLPKSVDVILGLRSMKRLDIRLSLRQDCAYIQNIAVPFECKITAATTVMAKKTQLNRN